MNLRSIRVRLTLWNVGVLALALLLFLVTMHFAVRTYLLTSIDRRLANQIQLFLRAETDSPFSRAPMRFRNGRIHVFDLQGHALATRLSPDAAAPWDMPALTRAAGGRAVYSTVPAEESPLRVYSVPLLRDGQPVGVVQAVFPLTELTALLEGMTMILLVLTPFALLAAAAGGLFLTERALRPMRQMANHADQLTADDLSRRLPVSGDDEFAHLATTFNGMIARLEAAFDELGQSVEQERRFIADASHELRTPLTAIKANTSLALRGERTPEQYRTALQATDQAADLMSRLVQDLLLLARSDNGQLPLEMQWISLVELANDAVSLVHGPEPRAKIELALPADLRVWGDPHHLQRLLGNLLENAFRHTPADGQIRIAARVQEGVIAIDVADTGEGIAPEHLPNLGRRFYRVDAARARQHGGSGLGLSICRSIAEAHGGTLTIASTPGHGTTVTVTLPAP